MLTGCWGPSPKNLVLEAGSSVHLWRIPLFEASGNESDLQNLVSREEYERVMRLHQSFHRQAKLAAYVARRRILGRYLDFSSEDLVFVSNEHGKPMLCGNSHGSDLRFNFSHSGRWALCAVALGRDVGVDLELVAEREGLLDIARRFFSRQESRALEELSLEAQKVAFYRYWTLKEAYVKAIGHGLSAYPLNQFIVDPSLPDWSCWRSDAQGPPGELDGAWRLANVDLGDAEYVGALATKGSVPDLTFLDYSTSSC